MADIIVRTYEFLDGYTAYGSQVDAEVQNIVDVVNNLNAGTTTWERVYAQHATSVPLISDVLGGSQNAAEFKSSSSTKASISSTGVLTLVPTSNQIVLGTTRTVTLTAPTPASASRTVTLPDLSGDYSVVGTSGTQAITGAKTFDSGALKIQEAASTDVATIACASLAASRTYTLPDAGGAADFVMNAGAQSIAGVKTFSGGAGAITLSSSTIAMGTNKITGLAAATSNGDATRFEQLKVLQVVQGTTTTQFTTTSSTFQATGLSASITPTSSSNRVMIILTSAIQIGTVNVHAILTVKRGSTDIGGGSNSGFVDYRIGSVTSSPFNSGVTISYIDSPATTSSTTYEMYLRNTDNAASIACPLGNQVSSIILMEVV